MFSSMFTTLLLAATSATAIPFVAAQNQTKMVTTDDLYGTLVSTAAPPGYNVYGGSVFQNYVNAVNDGQFFFLNTGSCVFEKPGSEPKQSTFLNWCSDLTFSDLSNSSIIGYAARCIQMILAGYVEAQAAGGQLTFDYSEGLFVSTWGISAVFVEQLNSFQSQYHRNSDNLVLRYWDDGRKSSPMIGWKGHDEGDMSANAATSSLSYFAEVTWVTVEEVAQIFNTSTDEFTPNTFKQVYEETWIKEHKKEAASDNPNAGAESEIIEEVEDEADSTDAATPIDDSGTRRKLVSVAGRFVSAALRVFGI